MTLEDAFALVGNLGPGPNPRCWVRLDCGADALLIKGEPALVTFHVSHEAPEYEATVRLELYRLTGLRFSFTARREAFGYVTVQLRRRA